MQIEHVFALLSYHMQIGMSIQREERVIFVDISRIEAGIMLNMQFKKVYVFTNADIKKEGVI